VKQDSEELHELHEVGGAPGACGGGRVFMGKLQENDYSKDLGVDGRIMLIPLKEIGWGYVK
jgi:hypothetical protein